MSNRRGLLSTAGLGTLALCGAIVLASSGTASAADFVPVPPPPPPPVVVESPFSWTGLYAGIHLTGLKGYIDLIRPQGEVPITFTVILEENTPLFIAIHGIGIGGHVGYNRQVGSFVFGGEVDFDYTRASGAVDPDPEDLDDTPLVFRSLWQASVRARAGIAAGNALFYATAGVAFGKGELSWDTLADTNYHVGWTAGVGTEVTLSDRTSVRFEARYTDFGTRTYDLNDIDFGLIDVHWRQWTATVGVSFLLGR